MGAHGRERRGRMRLAKVAFAFVLSVSSAACLFGSSRNDVGECTVDAECTQSTVACRETQCVDRQCITRTAPEGMAPATSALGQPPPCKSWWCTREGVAELVNAPAGPARDIFKDCKQTICDGNGNATIEPDVNDVPVSPVGDCQTSTCSPDGTAGQTADDTDIPKVSATCKKGTCTHGAPGTAPADVGTSCDDLGETCSSSGACDVCFTPDAACTDIGPGASAHTPTSPKDWGGIGRCDDGGRAWCGSVAAGGTAYFKYYDDQTGPFCNFDPRISFEPAGSATVCLLTECPGTPSCPNGWAYANPGVGTYRGCCATVGAGGTDVAIDYCRATHVMITVTTAEPCVGYRLAFNQ